MKLKFSLIILIFVLIAAISSTYFYALVTRSERRQLVDLRLQTFTERLIETDFLNLTREEFVEAQELRQALQNAGIHWLWRSKGAERSEGLRHLLDILPLKCLGNGFHSFEIAGTYVRCFQVLDKKDELQIIAASVLPRGTEPFFETQKLWWYFIFICFASLLVSILLMNWLLRPINKVQHSIEDFLDFIQSEAISAKKFSSYMSKAKNSQAVSFFDDDVKNLQEKFFSFLDQIEKYFRETKLYSYRVSHEIKTPLAVLSHQVSDLGRDPTLTTETQSKIFEIQKGLRDLNHFLKSFDLYQELSLPGQLSENLYSLDLVKSVVQVKDHLVRACVAQGKDGTLVSSRLEIDHTGRSERILAHPADLEHALQNLIVNALKYSEGQVLIQIRGCQVKIFDAGSGIPSEVRNQLGEPFNRGKEHSSPSPGFGLGLSIVSMICKKYGWSFKFEQFHGASTKLGEKSTSLNVASFRHTLTHCVTLDMSPFSVEMSQAVEFH